MPYFLVEDFRSGLDKRRMTVTSPSGTLTELTNGHITRGGEVEKGEAFVEILDLPANTFGLEATPNGFVVFGSAAVSPTILNANPVIFYQQLTVTSGANMIGVLSTDLFDGKVYVIAEYDDGTIHHFFNGTEVDDWYSAEARATFSITSGGADAASAASGNFELSGGFVGDKVAQIAVNGTNLLASAVVWASGEVLEDVISNTSSAINAYTATSGYTSTWSGNRIVITAVALGAGENGNVIAPTITGTLVASNINNMAGGTDASEISDITVNLVSVINAAVPWAGSNSQTAEAVAAVINNFTSTPNYTASAYGNEVTIFADGDSTTPNGYAVAVTATGSVTIDPSSGIAMQGGGNPRTAATGTVTLTGGASGSVDSITVNGVEILNSAVSFNTDLNTTATDVAAQINSFNSTPEYTATAAGAVITISAAATAGDTPNGFAVVSSGTTITTADVNMSGGETGTVFDPARYVKTLKTKMYALSGSLMRYSDVDTPSDWDSSGGGTGSGFENLSTNASGSQALVGLANYFDNLAIFSRNAVQIWFVDVDPSANQQLQVLNNTGAISPGSVVEFGDNDVFYLSESGIRSLRARDSSNAAFVNDVGTAIDTDIQDAVLANEVAAANSIAILEPREGRYMLTIGTTTYVFSYFPSNKISAWSTYTPGFTIDAWKFLGSIILARSGDKIYRFGGEASRVYDNSEVTLSLPFLDAQDPSTQKDWTAIDIACEGTWEVSVALDPEQPDTFTEVGTVVNTTYNDANVPLSVSSSHIRVKMVSKNSGYARVGNVALHYSSGNTG